MTISIPKGLCPRNAGLCDGIPSGFCPTCFGCLATWAVRVFTLARRTSCHSPPMPCRTLIRRSLRFHARSHCGVVLGAAIASATLIGALVVGDSVKETLRQRSLQRLAGAWYALAPTDRTFSPRVVIFPSGFTGPLTSPVLLPESPATTLLALPGTASTPVGKARANHVQVFGVDEDFGRFVGALELTHLSNGDIVLNKSLATQLCVQKGEPIILNVLRHSATSLEAAITPRDRQTIKLRLMVTRVWPAESGGDLDL